MPATKCNRNTRPWWFSSDAACREQRACVLGGGERVLSRDSDARCCCCRVGHRRAPAPDPAQREHPQRRQRRHQQASKNNDSIGLSRHLFCAASKTGRRRTRTSPRSATLSSREAPTDRRAGSIEQGRLSHRVCVWGALIGVFARAGEGGGREGG